MLRKTIPSLVDKLDGKGNETNNKGNEPDSSKIDEMDDSLASQGEETYAFATKTEEETNEPTPTDSQSAPGKPTNNKGKRKRLGKVHGKR